MALNVPGECDQPMPKGTMPPMVHHILPIKYGGNDDLDNLMLSCLWCETAYHGMSDTLHIIRNKALKVLHKYSTGLTNPKHPDFRVKQAAADNVVMIDHLKLEPRPTLKAKALWWIQHKIIQHLSKRNHDENDTKSK